ncbi:tol-pal system-associated acyl-CoA thioesterase [Pseudoxanthomonas sp. CAU 1598]|uniref:Tol-pal system-associated acyl-CoA thioesterase n=2 Tax=Pseudomarimonas arenosa TaxID=2774145 RepID=A0AAW3ZGR3_9GAMM|nr:tol-pal system-associated acyl-CoA thioesterase [Pseudomarimonas arenosa]MBD8524155.1 tol-pal system-associated acyl-CoA thioesterase [Pseudomarimonas arenosa]
MNAESAGRLPFSWPVRVYWEDTDAGGVVYHANYLCFFERCRSEWLRSLGIAQERFRHEFDRVFAIRSMHTDYRRASRLDDQLVVRVDEVRVGLASLDFRQSILRQGEDESIATAQVRVGCLVASSFKPTRMPDSLRQILLQATESGAD